MLCPKTHAKIWPTHSVVWMVAALFILFWLFLVAVAFSPGRCNVLGSRFLV
jgi:hypothetical protein